ncbi:MAG: histidinol dehydrogenase [Deltaproteobacteria bacterium]|nr:histidinol dehydrogenase [Deltaproteobacteria bacterium]
MKVLKSGTREFSEGIEQLLSRRHQLMDALSSTADDLILRYRKRGEELLYENAREMDGVHLSENQLWVDPSFIKSSYKKLSPEVREALEATKERVLRFQEELKLSSFQREEESGVLIGTEIRPLDRVGIYVPGGRANYFMSLMFCAAPARIAGVGEIIVATPPKKNLEEPFVDPAILYTAKLFDISKILVSGGPAALAALAFGTKKSLPVERLFGSGGKLSAVAKQRLSGYIGIGGFAGPSETAYICDQTSSVSILASDILARADSDLNAEIFVFHTKENFMEALLEGLAEGIRAIRDQRSRSGIEACLEKNTRFFIVKNIDESFAICNRIAPGTLCLSLKDASDYVDKVKACGSLLLGEYTPSFEADLTGVPSGLVPSMGSAAFTVSLSPAYFVRRFGITEISRQALERYSESSIALAKEVGYTTHEYSYRKRLEAGDTSHGQKKT